MMLGVEGASDSCKRELAASLAAALDYPVIDLQEEVLRSKGGQGIASVLDRFYSMGKDAVCIDGWMLQMVAKQTGHDGISHSIGYMFADKYPYPIIMARGGDTESKELQAYAEIASYAEHNSKTPIYYQ